MRRGGVCREHQRTLNPVRIEPTAGCGRVVLGAHDYGLGFRRGGQPERPVHQRDVRGGNLQRDVCGRRRGRLRRRRAVRAGACARCAGAASRSGRRSPGHPGPRPPAARIGARCASRSSREEHPALAANTFAPPNHRGGGTRRARRAGVAEFAHVCAKRRSRPSRTLGSGWSPDLSTAGSAPPAT